MRLVAFLACLLLGLFPYAVAASDRLDADDLARIIRELASFSAETSMLLGQLEQRAVTRTYAEIHLEKLKEEIGDARHELEAPAPDRLRPKQAKTIELVQALDADLTMMKSRVQDAAALQQGRERAAQISRTLAALEKTS